jgi:hypothetical protein
MIAITPHDLPYGTLTTADVVIVDEQIMGVDTKCGHFVDRFVANRCWDCRICGRRNR